MVFFDKSDDVKLPTESSLEHVRGHLTAVNERFGRFGRVRGAARRRGHHVVLDVESRGVGRRIISYDKTLLRDLKPGVAVSLGVFPNRNDSELWTLVADSGVTRTFDETLALRGKQIRENRRFFRIFASVACLILLAQVYLLIRNPE
jgi:hypothetical protein